MSYSYKSKSYSLKFRAFNDFLQQINFLHFLLFLGQGKATLPDDSMALICSASSLLQDVGRRLKNAEIDVKMLQIVQKNRETFLKLHYLLSDIEKSQSGEVKPEENKIGRTGGGDLRGTGAIELFLDMRVEELEAFKKERDAVFSFVEICSAIESG